MPELGSVVRCKSAHHKSRSLTFKYVVREKLYSKTRVGIGNKVE